MEHTALTYLGIFFLVAAAQGMFFSISQLSNRSKLNAPRVFLSAIIFFFSLSLIESGLWWSDAIGDFVHMILVSEPLPFLYGPLIYFYFKSSFSDRGIVKKDLFHFLPFVICFVYCSQFYFSAAASKSAMMEDRISFHDFFAIRISSLYITILKAVSLLAYCLFALKEFYLKATSLKEVRSWFLLTICVYIFYILSFIVFHVLSRYHIIGGCADYGIALSMAVFIYLFSWFGFSRPRIFDGYSVNEVLHSPLEKKYRSSVLTPVLEQELAGQLSALMRSEKLYRKEDLRLDTLAERLGVSRNSISQVINSSGMNFFEYVNHWRIEEAKALLAATGKKELNIIEVAYEVGFSNKVSFNKHFKKLTGVTPSEFRKVAGQK